MSRIRLRAPAAACPASRATRGFGNIAKSSGGAAIRALVVAAFGLPMIALGEISAVNDWDDLDEGVDEFDTSRSTFRRGPSSRAPAVVRLDRPWKISDPPAPDKMKPAGDAAARGSRRSAPISNIAPSSGWQFLKTSSTTVSCSVIPSRDPITGEISLNFPTTPGTTYLIQYIEDLTASWQDLRSMTAEVGQFFVVVRDIAAGAQPQRFYRVTVTDALPTPTPTIVPTSTPVSTVTATPTPTPGSMVTPTPTATALLIPPVGPLTPTPTIGPLESNAPPIVSAGSNRLAVVNQPVQLRGTATDDGKPNGGTLTIFWTIVGGPVSVTPSNPSELQTSVTFSQPGSYTARLTASDSELSVSSDATIMVAARNDLTYSSARSTRGTEFWVAFPGIGYSVVPTPTPRERPAARSTFEGVHPDTLTPITDAVPTLSVLIAAEQGATGSVQIPGLSVAQAFMLAPGTTKRVSVSPLAMISANDYVENKGVFIQTDRPVTVFAVARRDLYSQKDPRFPELDILQPRLADSLVAYLVHPVPSLGLSYRVVAPGTFRGSGFTVVATDDDTIITVDLVVSYASRTAGLPYQVVLQRGQTYQFRSNAPVYGEETGTMVTSTKPIVVIGGNDFRGDPVGFNNAYAAQLSPISQGGTQYVVRRLDPRLADKPYEVTIMANEGEAAVFLDGEDVGKTFAWSPLVLNVTGTKNLQTDNPVQVVESTRDRIYVPAIATDTADFTMTAVPAASEGSSSYLLSPLADEHATTLATVTISNAARPSLRLNGAAVDDALFTPVANTDLYTAQISLGLGASLLISDKPFRAWLSAFAPIVFHNVLGSNRLDTYIASFATPAGLEFGELEADSTFSLINDPQAVAPGQAATVTARVLNAAGRPLGGIRIDYAISGANPAAGHAYSDFEGYANFQYVGHTSGIDLVVASAGSRVAQGQVTWGFGAPPATPTPLVLTPTPLPTRIPVPTATPTPTNTRIPTPTPTLRPGTPTRTPTPSPTAPTRTPTPTPTVTPVAINTQYVNIYLEGSGNAQTIVLGQPISLHADADRPALLSDFYIQANSARLPDYKDPAATPESLIYSRWIHWFPPAVGDYEISVVGNPVSGVVVNLPSTVSFHVVAPPIDSEAPLVTEYAANGTGPTEVVLKWPYSVAGRPIASVKIERRRADLATWTVVGTYDHQTAEGWTGAGLFVTDIGLKPSTAYNYRFTYLSGSGVSSPPSAERITNTPGNFPRFAVVDLTGAIGRVVQAPTQGKRSVWQLRRRSAAGPPALGDGRVIAINSQSKAVVEQIIDGVKSYWLWDPSNVSGPIEIPSGTTGRGGFVVTGLSNTGRVSGRWDTGDRNDDQSIRYHAAFWDPGDELPTDLMPMDAKNNKDVLEMYFDDISFQYLPNSIPMSWSANGVNSTGLITGMVTRNKGRNAPGSNANYAARWDTSKSLQNVQFLKIFPNSPDLPGFDASAYAMAESGIVAGSSLRAPYTADPRNQNDHYHAFCSLPPDGNPNTSDPIDLGTGGGWHSEGWGVNNDGQVTGVTTINPNDPYWKTQAYVTAGAGQPITTVLPTLNGKTDQFYRGYGFARAVNDAGWVVGQSLSDPSQAAPGRKGKQESYGCLWKKNNGVYEVMALHALVPGSDWIFDIGTCINNDNIVGATGFVQPASGQTVSTYHSAALLIPAEMVPDWNRDGVIDEKDTGIITTRNPWRFWVNDDDDSGDAGAVREDGNTDVPGSGNNGMAQRVNGIRDLIDYFPIWFNIELLLKIFPSSQFDYVLTSNSTALQYTETTLKHTRSDAYLRGELGEPTAPDNPNGLANRLLTTVGTQQPAKLSKPFLDNIRGEIGGMIVVEASKATTLPLTLSIWPKNQDSVLCEISMPISIDGVEKMFRHKSLRRAVPSWSNQVNGPGDRYVDSEPENYPDVLCNDRNFLFVHGYSINGEQARGWHSEIYKRMFWSGSNGRFYGISWAGDRNQFSAPILGLVTPNFHKAVIDAQNSAQSLAAFVRTIVGSTTIAAHSLGNLVTTCAESDFGLNVENVFLINAAQTIEQFDSNAVQDARLVPIYWTAYSTRVWPTEWFRIFDASSDARSTLTWRNRVANHRSTRFNFYSDVSLGLGDHVMRVPPAGITDEYVVQLAASFNAFIGSDKDGVAAFFLQERLKGRFIHESLGSTYGGWLLTEDYYDPTGPTFRTPTPTEADSLTNDELKEVTVFDPGYTVHNSAVFPTPVLLLRPGAPPWIPSLTSPDDNSASAVAEEHPEQLLAEVIPGRTLPVGGNPIGTFEERNFDMQDIFHVGWPSSRSSGGSAAEWRHSDIRLVAYTFIYPLFDTFVELGSLK